MKANSVLRFERGQDAKRNLRIGRHRNDLFTRIQSMSFIEAMQTFPELGSDNDKIILNRAAKMLEVPPEKVLIAMDKDQPVYSNNSLMDDFLDADWEYDKEDTVESHSMSFHLIGSSTGEIYVQDEKTDEILYILGTIY